MAYGTITETLDNVLKLGEIRIFCYSPENGLREIEGIEFQINMPIDLDVDFIVTKY